MKANDCISDEQHLYAQQDGDNSEFSHSRSRQIRHNEDLLRITTYYVQGEDEEQNLRCRASIQVTWIGGFLAQNPAVFTRSRIRHMRQDGYAASPTWIGLVFEIPTVRLKCKEQRPSRRHA